MVLFEKTYVQPRPPFPHALPIPSNWEPPVQENTENPGLHPLDSAITTLAQAILPAAETQPGPNKPAVQAEQLKQAESPFTPSQTNQEGKSARKQRKQRTYFPAGKYSFSFPSRLT